MKPPHLQEPNCDFFWGVPLFFPFARFSDGKEEKNVIYCKDDSRSAVRNKFDHYSEVFDTMKQAVAVRFEENGKEQYFDPAGLAPQPGDYVMAETPKGPACGQVSRAARPVPDYLLPKSLPALVRMADSVDIRRMHQRQNEDKKAWRICRDQIGVRDESKMMGGIGLCGQPFCCSRFLRDFQPVSIRMAKEQGLSLNPTKISGCCGRLMCCLGYEQSAYEYLNSIMPMVGSTVRTPDGTGTVVETNPISGYLRVRLNSEALAPKYYKASQCQYLSGGKRAPRRPDPDDDYSGLRDPAPVVARAGEDDEG